MSVLIITPTYNERENIQSLVSALHSNVPDADVLVVDDNSPDGTHKLIESMSQTDPKVHLLLREKKEGLARAYIEGMQWGLSKDYDYFVQMDADFSHPPETVPKLLAKLQDYDLALGSRYIPEGGVSGWPLSRRFISKYGNLYARTVLGLPIKDLTGGFFAWRKTLLNTINVATSTSRGYAFIIELKYRAYLSKAKIVEVPFVFPDRTKGKSKMSSEIFSEAAKRVVQLRINKKHLISLMQDRKLSPEAS